MSEHRVDDSDFQLWVRHHAVEPRIEALYRIAPDFRVDLWNCRQHAWVESPTVTAPEMAGLGGDTEFWRTDKEAALRVLRIVDPSEQWTEKALFQPNEVTP